MKQEVAVIKAGNRTGLGAVLSLCALLATANAQALEIPMNGLVYRLDAAAGSPYVTCDEQGHVTQWTSIACDPALADIYGNIKFTGGEGLGLPYFRADGFGGHGSIQFGYETDGTTPLCTFLESDIATSNRTIIIVFKCPKREDWLYLWGSRIRGMGVYPSYYWLKMPTEHLGGPVWLDGKRLEAETTVYPDARILAVEGSQALAQTVETTGRDGLVCRTMIGNIGQLGGNEAWRTIRYARAEIAEVIVYDRPLDNKEHALVYEVLRRKWLSDFRIWTGRGSSASWNDGGNWSGGQVPVAGASVIVSDAAVTIPADVRVGEMIADNVAFTLSNGAKLTVGAITQDLGSDISVAGNGSVVKLGGGALSVGGAWDFAVPLVLGAGTLDLAGGTLSVPSITGAGSVTNSAEAVGTLVLSQAADSDLQFVAGNVKVVKAKAGTLAIAKSVSTGELVIGGGTVKAVTNAVPEAFAGLTLHLDASRPETIARDGDGYVLEWHSTVGGVVLTPQSENGDLPFYSVNAYGDCPAVVFGQTKASVSSKNCLVGDRAVCNKTIIVVSLPAADKVPNMGGLYGIWHADFGIRREAVGQYKWDDGGVFAGRNGDQAYVDGVLSYDPETGLIPSSQSGSATYTWAADWMEWSVTVPHVLTAITAETDSSKMAGVPAVGSYYTNWNRAWAGDVYEIIVYDRVLTAAERMTIETALMSKWNILGNLDKSKKPGTTELSGGLSEKSAVRVTGNSMLDFGGMSQTLPSLTLDAGDETDYPCLTIAGVPGALNLSAIDFSLMSAQKIEANQKLMDVPGGLQGAFKTTDLPTGTGIKYKATEIFFHVIRGLILLLK